DSVSRTCRPCRSKTGQPSSSSNRAICWLRAGWETPHTSAALAKFRCSSIFRKCRRGPSSITHPYRIYSLDSLELSPDRRYPKNDRKGEWVRDPPQSPDREV